MTISRSILYAVTGVLCLVACNSAHAESLRDAVQTALQNHPSIDVAKAQQQEASEERKEQVSELYPQFSTTAAGGRIFGNNSTTRGLNVTRGEAYSWLWEGSASITQPIFNGFETYRRVDAAKDREGAADFALADAEQEIALRAVQAYLNVLRSKEAYAKTLSYKETLQDYLKRINSMLASGAADEAEAAQAKTIQAMFENTVAEMDGQVQLALADYAEAVGTVPAAELEKVYGLDDPLFKDMDKAIEKASVNHPLLLAARKKIDAEEKEIKADTGSLLPDLNSELSYLKKDQKEEIGGEVVDARALMRMNWDFSLGGGQLAKIRKSKAERSEALARSAQTQRQVERDIRRAHAEFETASKQNTLLDERLSLSQNLFETYQKQFEGSKVRLLQLMQAQNQLFSTELEKINADYRVLRAEYSMLASEGRILQALSLGAPILASENAVVEEPVSSVLAPVTKTAEPPILEAPSYLSSKEEEVKSTSTSNIKAESAPSGLNDSIKSPKDFSNVPSVKTVPPAEGISPVYPRVETPVYSHDSAVDAVVEAAPAPSPSTSGVWPLEDYPDAGKKSL